MELIVERKALQSLLSQVNGKFQLIADQESGMAYSVHDSGLYLVKTGVPALIKASGFVDLDVVDLRRIATAVGDSATIRLEDKNLKVKSEHLEALIPALASSAPELGKEILARFDPDCMNLLFECDPETLDSLLQGAFAFQPGKVSSAFNVFELSRGGEGKRYLQCVSTTGVVLSMFRISEPAAEEDQARPKFRIYLPLAAQKIIRIACRWAAESGDKVAVYGEKHDTSCLVSTSSGRIAFLVARAADSRFPDPAVVEKLVASSKNLAVARLSVKGGALAEAFDLCASLSADETAKTSVSVSDDGTLKISNVTGSSFVVREVPGSLESGSQAKVVINANFASTMARRILQAGDAEELDMFISPPEAGKQNMLVMSQKREEDYQMWQFLMSFAAEAAASA